MHVEYLNRTTAPPTMGSTPRGRRTPRHLAVPSMLTELSAWGTASSPTGRSGVVDDARATRHYDDSTFTLVTRWECADGVAEDVADVIFRSHHFERHDGLEQRGRGLGRGGLKRLGSGDLERVIV